MERFKRSTHKSARKHSKNEENRHFGSQNIVNRGEWLWNPPNIKGANKDFKIYVGRSTTVHNLLFCSHTLCMNYVTNTFPLVSSSVRSKQPLCFVHGQGQKREQKHTTKNFEEFHNHSPLLTMVKKQDLMTQISVNRICLLHWPKKSIMFMDMRNSNVMFKNLDIFSDFFKFIFEEDSAFDGAFEYE